MFPSCQGSQFCIVFCPVFGNSCFIIRSQLLHPLSCLFSILFFLFPHLFSLVFTSLLILGSLTHSLNTHTDSHTPGGLLVFRIWIISTVFFPEHSGTISLPSLLLFPLLFIKPLKRERDLWANL